MIPMNASTRVLLSALEQPRLARTMRKAIVLELTRRAKLLRRKIRLLRRAVKAGNTASLIGWRGLDPYLAGLARLEAVLEEHQL